MIHVVTAANRELYARQLREMHRLRWKFYIEDRGWSELRAIQAEPDLERDQFDDDRAVYLLALSDDGDVEGSMRVRPTDDHSLLFDVYPRLVAPESAVTPAADIWEITRVMRAPAFRGSDGALRLRLNCAACEFALTRGVRRYVAVADTFLTPAMLALNPHKHRLLGSPQPYAQGEMVAVEITPDHDWLSVGRKVAKLRHAMMLELPPPGADDVRDPIAAARLRAPVPVAA